MNKIYDRRYSRVKAFIRQKKLITFGEIFNHIPKSTVSKDLNIGYSWFVKLTKRPDDFKLGHMIKLAQIIQVSLWDVLKLIKAEKRL